MGESGGDLAFQPVVGWGRLPDGPILGDVTGVGVDSLDRVFVYNRGDHPVVVLDPDGRYLRSWGAGFKSPQGMCMGTGDSVYLTDDGDHTVQEYSPEGTLLMTLGVSGKPSDTGYVRGDRFSVKYPGPPFNRPAGVALSPSGEIYVADGYGNACIHKFSPDGRLLLSWGGPGDGPGEFRNPHGLFVDEDETVYVGDKLNSRVQVFGPTGRFLSEWLDAYRPTDVLVAPDGKVYVAELGYLPDLPMRGPIPSQEDSYARVTIRSKDGEVLASVTGPDPRAPEGLIGPHSIELDSRGNLYVGEVAAASAKTKGIDPGGIPVLRKFTPGPSR